MIIDTTGLLGDHFYVAGLSTYPIQLLDCGTPVLFDGGTTCGGRFYRDDIRSILGTRAPEILFITHSHWDHCGAVSYLKEAFPTMKIAGSPLLGKVMRRPNAVTQMIELNKGTKPIIAGFPGLDPSLLIDEPFRPFDIDMELVDGRAIELGEGLTVEVFETPGHTRDHMSYYIPEKKILVASEACGCLDGTDAVIVQFLADYEAYSSSLKRLAELPVEILCQGHRLAFVGREEVKSFFDRSLRATIHFRERVEELLASEGTSIEDVVMRIKAEQYDTNTGIKQPEVPYLLNLRAQVNHLAAKVGRQENLHANRLHSHGMRKRP